MQYWIIQISIAGHYHISLLLEKYTTNSRNVFQVIKLFLMNFKAGKELELYLLISR